MAHLMAFEANLEHLVEMTAEEMLNAPPAYRRVVLAKHEKKSWSWYLPINALKAMPDKTSSSTRDQAGKIPSRSSSISSSASDTTTSLTAFSSLASASANSHVQHDGNQAKTGQPSSSEPTKTAKAKTTKSHTVGVSTQVSSSSNLAEVKRSLPASTALPVASSGAEETSTIATKPSGSSKRPSRFGPPLLSTLAPAEHQIALSAVDHSPATTSKQPSVLSTTSQPSMRAASNTEERTPTTASVASIKSKNSRAQDSRLKSFPAAAAQASSASSSSLTSAGSSAGPVPAFVSDTVTPKPKQPSTIGTASATTVVSAKANDATDDSASLSSKASLRPAGLKASTLSSTSSTNPATVPMFSAQLDTAVAAQTSSASSSSKTSAGSSAGPVPAFVSDTVTPKPTSSDSTASATAVASTKAKGAAAKKSASAKKPAEPTSNILTRSRSRMLQQQAAAARSHVIKPEPVDQDDDVIEIDGPMCKLCVDEPATVTFRPCNHTLCCAPCCIRLKRCPRCSRKIDFKIKPDGSEVRVPGKTRRNTKA